MLIADVLRTQTEDRTGHIIYQLLGLSPKYVSNRPSVLSLLLGTADMTALRI